MLFRSRVSPGEEDAVIATASELTSVTLGRTAKAGAASLIEDQAALSIAGNADELVNGLEEIATNARREFELTAGAPGTYEYGDAEEFIASKIAPLLDAAFLPEAQATRLRESIITGAMRGDTLTKAEIAEGRRRDIELVNSILQKRALGIESAQIGRAHV